MPPPTKSLIAALTRKFALQPPRLLLLLQLLLLSLMATRSGASPISSPEITSISINSQQQQQQQQQQQHSNTNSQQQKQYKSGGGQDAHLNSLSAYATNYDSISPSSDNSGQGPNFKPSYKLPDIENNFQPIQTIMPTGAGTSAPSSMALSDGTPILMQYLPQTVNEGGMQYLQLIPTHPLIVPIGPYLHMGSEASHSPIASYHSLSAGNSISPEYGQRPSAMLTSVPANNAPPAPTAMVELPPGMGAYGVPQYAANNLQPYRNNYRINREIKPKQLPDGLTLNLNEYLPGPHDAPQQSYNRGRP